MQVSSKTSVYKLIVFRISVLVILILSLLRMCTQPEDPSGTIVHFSGVIGIRKPGQTLGGGRFLKEGKAGQISVMCEEVGEARDLAWYREEPWRGPGG